MYAGTKGFLDDVPVPQVREFEKAMLNHFQGAGKQIWNELDQKKALDADLEKKLTDAIANFKAGWKPKA